jgi:predicted acyl esterase
MGWPVVELWVASSDTDADLFVYLEDYDPKADKARCAVLDIRKCFTKRIR